MTFASHYLVMPVVLPLLAAFILPIAGRIHETLSRVLGVTALFLTLLFSLNLFANLSDTGPIATQLGGFKAPLGISFYADQLAAGFLVVLSAGLLLFWPEGAGTSVKVRVLYLLLLAGGSGLVLSGDLFNIFVFYEIISVASFGLAASANTGAGYASSLRYLVLSALGSSLALLGIALVYGAAGTLNLADLSQLAPTRLTGPLGAAAFLLLLLGFGVKAELFPVNSWVPEVYATAPSDVTAILAGLVSKLALLVLLRLLVLVFHDPVHLQLLLVFGLLGVIAGEFAAYRARTLNHVLAYSSIAQLGLVAIAFSISGMAGVLAGLALALHHAVVKPAFFVLAARWGGDLSKLAGGAKSSPLAAALFVLLALSMLGIPPLPGFWAKYLLLGGALASDSPLYMFAVLVVLIATAVEAGYLFRIIGSLYGAPGKEKVKPLPFREFRAGAALGVLLLLAMVFMPQLSTKLIGIATEASDVSTYVTSILGNGR